MNWRQDCKDLGSLHFLGLASDYDGTLAQHGFVHSETCDALRQLKETGPRL